MLNKIKNSYYGLSSALRKAENSNSALLECIPIGTQLWYYFQGLNVMNETRKSLTKLILTEMNNCTDFLQYKHQVFLEQFFGWAALRNKEAELFSELRVYLKSVCTEYTYPIYLAEMEFVLEEHLILLDSWPYKDITLAEALPYLKTETSLGVLFHD